MKKHLISQDITLMEALSNICELAPEPLVLFVLNEKKQMVGTLTDGDSRRALIKGASMNDQVSTIMHQNFNYVKVDDLDNVTAIKRLRELKIKLIPVLDDDNHIVEIINLEEYKTRLPFDAVLMAGGKGERLRPLTETTPKPLLKVGDKCIIDHNIDRLISYGVKHISVTVNYLKEQIEEQVELFLSMARNGTVLASPAISKGEQAVMRAVLNAGFPLIFLSPWGFNSFSKPGHQYFDACAEGRFLILSPWPHHNERIPLTRQMCLELNKMTEEVCGLQKY